MMNDIKQAHVAGDVKTDDDDVKTGHKRRHEENQFGLEIRRYSDKHIRPIQDTYVSYVSYSPSTDTHTVVVQTTNDAQNGREFGQI